MPRVPRTSLPILRGDEGRPRHPTGCNRTRTSTLDTASPAASSAGDHAAHHNGMRSVTLCDPCRRGALESSGSDQRSPLLLDAASSKESAFLRRMLSLRQFAAGIQNQTGLAQILAIPPPDGGPRNPGFASLRGRRSDAPSLTQSHPRRQQFRCRPGAQASPQRMEAQGPRVPLQRTSHNGRVRQTGAEVVDHEPWCC